MKRKLFSIAGVLAALLALMVMAGCKTTVSVTYTEPAKLDLGGVKRVAIDSNNPQATASISQKLAATGKYTVAAATELSEWKEWKPLASYQAQAIKISAADLVGAYAGNVARADSSYKGKALRVTGVVKEIEESSKGRYFIRLTGTGNDSVVVYFVASEKSLVEAVNKGQTITVIGQGYGRNLPDMDDTAEILRLLGAGSTVNISEARFPVAEVYPGAIDAVISLNTTSTVKDDSRTVKEAARDANGNEVKDGEGKTVYQDVTVYDRSVTVNIAYQIVRAQDSSNIGQGTKSATSNTVSDKDRAKLPTIADLTAKTIDKPLGEFSSEIVPTQRSIPITLAKESENKEAKKEMGAADKLVKAKKYADAAAAYGEIYATYKNFAAGYNQAVLTEAAMGTEAAVKLMEALAKETGNSMAQETLRGMQSRNAANQKAAAQLSK